MFGNVAGFTGFYSAGALTTQTLAAYIGSQIPTLEKQFGLSSQESGTLMTFMLPLRHFRSSDCVLVHRSID
jgi:hypothetical protein